MADESQKHILFLTGKLAEKRLHRVLESMQSTKSAEFSYEVKDIGVSVAALMTASMIQRRLSPSDVEGFDQVLVPGLCRGDLDAVGEQLGLPVIRGTEDLKDLPVFFGGDAEPPDLSRYDVALFAEIVDAPMLDIPAILSRAARYREDGADVIDVGCLPDTPFPHLEETIEALHGEGHHVSVDSLEEDDLVRAGKAGADYLLSLKESSLWIADEVDSIPVLIPDRHKDMDSLYRAIETLDRKGRSFIADSVLDPIHFGFTESLLRYLQLRQQCPDIDIMMGIGNLTELTEADTTGINAVLFGLISEMHITSILTTEVSPHARSAVREADRARRIMYAAREDHSLPKGYDDSLLTTHSRKPFPYTANEILELAGEIRDPSYRVQISDEGISVYNRDGLKSGTDPFDLFPDLELLQDDAPHAFYMGVELAKAQIAWQLGKRYNQDELLDWGVAVPAVSREQQEESTRAAHALREGEYKQEGSTLKASRKKKKKKKNYSVSGK